MANVVFVDDDFASELTVENLRMRGHAVRRISSVDDALANVKQIAASDLVVLDRRPRPRGVHGDSASASFGRKGDEN